MCHEALRDLRYQFLLAFWPVPWFYTGVQSIVASPVPYLTRRVSAS